MTHPRPQYEFDVIHITNELAVGKTGGVGTVVDNLASGLNQVGLRTLWFLIDEGWDSTRPHDKSMGGAAIATGPIEDLRRYTAPILHIHCYEPHEKLLEICSERRSVYTIHSLLSLEAKYNDIDLSHSIRWQEQLISSVDCIVLISLAEQASYVAQGYQRLNPNVRVVYNGTRSGGQFRSPRGSETIGFCGRLVPRKKPEYPQLVLNQRGFETCRTLIAGRGFSPYARELILREGLADRVEYLGWCAGARLEAFFDRIDVLAVPSTYEPFGLVALEAMCRGVPVICPRSGGLTEVLGDHAYYYADTTLADFTAASSAWIASSPAEREQMAQGAFSRYQAQFTDRHMAAEYAALYAELVNQPALPVIHQ